MSESAVIEYDETNEIPPDVFHRRWVILPLSRSITTTLARPMFVTTNLVDMVDHTGGPADALAPDTVTEAVAFLASEGYVDEFSLRSDGLVVSATDPAHSLETAIVDYTFRFEGPSDPADEAIVLGISCPARGSKGIVVSAYGPYADPEQAALLAALADIRQKS